MNSIKKKENRKFKVLCPERPEIAEAALKDLAESFRLLGITGWNLPDITINFVNTLDATKSEFVKTGKITNQEVEINFDQRFATHKSQRILEYEIKLKDKDYPGFRQTLKHELARVALWSVTGLDRQSAVRLLNEGWASLVEQLGTYQAPDVEVLVNKTKLDFLNLKNKNAEIYERCLDFEHPVSNLKEEKFNGGEYVTGRAMLLWILKTCGKEKMIELLKKAITTSRLNTDVLIPAATDPFIHKGHEAYRKLINTVQSGSASKEEIEARALDWEAQQFRAALLELTGLSSLEEVKEGFLKWAEV